MNSGITEATIDSLCKWELKQQHFFFFAIFCPKNNLSIDYTCLQGYLWSIDDGTESLYNMQIKIILVLNYPKL